MKILTKSISLLLVALMALTALIACKKDDPGVTGDSESNSETEIETTQWGDVVIDNEIPKDLDYGGKAVNILVRSGEQYRREWFTEEPKNALQQEIYYRNLEVEDELGVTLNYIVEAEGTKCESINDKILQVARAGMGGYDIVNNYCRYAGNMNLLPYYANLRSGEFTYLKLDQGYWSEEFNAVANNFGTQIFCVGYANLSFYDRAMVLFFNKAEVERLEIGEEWLYDTALSGGWTYEVFYNLVKDVWEDTGTTQGQKDKEDFVGISGIRGSECHSGLFYSLGCTVTETDELGNHRVVTGTAKTHTENAYQMLIDLWYSAGAFMSPVSMDNYIHFTEGHSLFNLDVVYHYEQGNNMMREMEDGYGLIPCPKYDTDQEKYLSGAQDAFNSMSVLDHAQLNEEMISAVLELMASKGYEQIRPYYFERIVKGQQLDSKSGQCFDLVMEGVTLDYAEVYGVSIEGARDVLWGDPFLKYGGYGTYYGGEATTFTAAYAANQTRLNEAIAAMDTFLIQLAG